VDSGDFAGGGKANPEVALKKAQEVMVRLMAQSAAQPGRC
jgi:hypothetical protein